MLLEAATSWGRVGKVVLPEERMEGPEVGMAGLAGSVAEAADSVMEPLGEEATRR